LKTNVEISIVTVGMNHLKYIKSLLKSLYIDHRPKSSFEMIYVDNCSSDGSVEFIEKHYPSVKIIINKIPLGFGENNNKGVSEAIGKYIAIINPDIEFQTNSLDVLHEYSEKLNYNCIMAPKLLNIDHTLQYSVRGFITPWVFIMRLITGANDSVKNKVVQNYLCRDINPNQIQFIDWALGAAWFLNADLYKKLKGFDTSYFLYVEDVDLCLRSWKIGAPVIYNPNSEMVHNHLRSSTKVNKKSWIHLKSLMIYFLKHGIFVNSRKHTSLYKLVPWN